MKQKLSVLLICGLLLAVLPGCSPNTDSSSAPDAAIAGSVSGEASADAPGGYTPSGEEKLHITVESAEVTLDELKENDYQVTLLVNLDKNAGISSSQWGLQFEPSCTVEANNRGMIVSTVHAINKETHFLWTAWASTEETTEEGGLLQLSVKLPMDAAPGDSYTITYADTSAVGAAHQWKSLSDNYVEADQVGWTDGVITVVE